MSRAPRALVAVGAIALVLPAVAAARTVTRTDAQSGRSTAVRVGDTLELRLASCTSSCGYAWTFTQRPSTKVLRRLSVRLVAPERPPGTVGGSETLVVRYRVVGRGTARLRAVYAGPSEPRAKTFRLTVTAR